MGTYIDFWRTKKVGDVDFDTVYNKMDDKKMQIILEQEKRDFEESYSFYEGKGQELELLKEKYEEKKKWIEGKNAVFSKKNEKEKEEIRKNESELVVKLFKNPQMLSLMNNEIMGEIFDYEKQVPIKEIDKKDLKRLYEEIKDEDINDTNKKVLKRLITEGDFENYYYYIEAYY